MKLETSLAIGCDTAPHTGGCDYLGLFNISMQGQLVLITKGKEYSAEKDDRTISSSSITRTGRKRGASKKSRKRSRSRSSSSSSSSSSSNPSSSSSSTSSSSSSTTSRPRSQSLSPDSSRRKCNKKRDQKKKHNKEKKKKKKARKSKNDTPGPVQLSKFLRDRQKDERYSMISGKKIKMKVKKTREDKERDKNRAELLHFLNQSM